MKFQQAETSTVSYLWEPVGLEYTQSIWLEILVFQGTRLPRRLDWLYPTEEWFRCCRRTISLQLKKARFWGIFLPGQQNDSLGNADISRIVFSLLLSFSRGLWCQNLPRKHPGEQKKATMSDWASSATQWSGVVEHLQASKQACCSRHQALIFWCHILTLAALSLLSDNVGSLLSAIFTLSQLLWPPDVMESLLLSYHLQIPSLKKGRARDGH